MLPSIFLFDLELPSYTLLILCGFAAGLFVALWRSSVYAFRKDEILASYFLAGIGSFFGGKLLFVAQGFPRFLELHQTEGLSFFEYFSQAGLVFYGGMIGCIGFMALAAHLFHVPAGPLMDTLLPSLPLAQAFGRVGCFLIGCCYGIPSEFGFYMPQNSIAPKGVRLLPIQLFESIGVLILFWALLRIGRKPTPKNQLLGIYLSGYGLLRFVLEFFRGDAVRGFIGPFSLSQWISLICILVGLGLVRYSVHAPVQKWKETTDEQAYLRFR